MIGQRVLPHRNLEPLQATHKPLLEALVAIKFSIDGTVELTPESFIMSSNHMLLEVLCEDLGDTLNLYHSVMIVGSNSYVFRDAFRQGKKRVFYIYYRVSKVVCVDMSEEIRYYKGKHKVKVLSKSRGNWVVEALEPFEDIVNGQKVKVKAGERRIVVPSSLFAREGLSPPVKEHAYELKMEKKLKRLVDEEEKKHGETA
jgi:hypothetical protein